MVKWVFLNDRFIEEEKAVLHFRDLSFQRGYGVFDFFRLVENKPLFLEHHIDRFYFSSEGMHLPFTLERQEFTDRLSELILQNNLPNSGVRISLTGGFSEDGYTIGKPNLVLSQHQFSPPSEEQRRQGISLITYEYQRQLPYYKTIDYLMAIWLQPLRTEKKADDILYHQNGLITESPRSNFFLVTKENKIITPAENVLSGITRKKIIVLAKKDFEVEERDIELGEIKEAKEAFLTSTTKQVLPVRRINDTVFGSTEVANLLLRSFQETYC
jgi:branched-chain amino acid aminotransferase